MVARPADPARPTFSYSRLQKFDQCPAAYELRYIKHVQPAGLSIESYLGSSVHATLQWLYETVGAGGSVPFDGLLQHYREAWSQGWSKFNYINNPGWKTDDYFQLGVRMLAGYYRHYAPFAEPVFKIEYDFTIALSPDDDVLLRVIIDRVDSHAAGHWSIHDYKTGKNKLTAAKAERDLQMRIYYLALKRKLDEVERVDVVWHFLRHGEEQRLDNQQWSTNRLMGGLRKRIARIREAESSGGQFAPKEGVLCNWCFYWAHCEAKTEQTHPARLA